MSGKFPLKIINSPLKVRGVRGVMKESFKHGS